MTLTDCKQLEGDAHKRPIGTNLHHDILRPSERGPDASAASTPRVRTYSLCLCVAPSIRKSPFCGRLLVSVAVCLNYDLAPSSVAAQGAVTLN